jgi:hypothetical protein
MGKMPVLHEVNGEIGKVPVVCEVPQAPFVCKQSVFFPVYYQMCKCFRLLNVHQIISPVPVFLHVNGPEQGTIIPLLKISSNGFGQKETDKDHQCQHTVLKLVQIYKRTTGVAGYRKPLSFSFSKKR